MSEDDAVKVLNELSHDDREVALSDAEAVLVTFLVEHGYSKLAIAYEDTCQRIGF